MEERRFWLLAIDTSTETASVAVSFGDELRAELTWQAGQNHTVELLPNVLHVVQQAHIELKDIGGIVVAKGPGSFNGLRVGMSTAKGLAFALNLPLVGVSTLEAEAYAHSAAGLPVCPIFNAGRGEIATAIFRLWKGIWQRLLDEQVTGLDNLMAEVSGNTIFCGAYVRTVASQLQERLGEQAIIVSPAALFRRGGYLAELGWSRLKLGESDDLVTLEPMYLRRPSITVGRERREA